MQIIIHYLEMYFGAISGIFFGLIFFFPVVLAILMVFAKMNQLNTLIEPDIDTVRFYINFLKDKQRLEEAEKLQQVLRHYREYRKTNRWFISNYEIKEEFCEPNEKDDLLPYCNITMEDDEDDEYPIVEYEFLRKRKIKGFLPTLAFHLVCTREGI